MLAPATLLQAESPRFHAPVFVAAFDQPNVNADKQQSGEPKSEKDADEESTAAFRHSPTVQWFANLLHMDVETTARIFEYVNFGIVILAIAIPLFKLLPKVLRKRSETLSHELQTARAATESANARLSAIEAKFSGLDTEIAAIRKQVEEDTRNDEIRIKTSIEEETARIVAAAEHEIGIAAMQAQRGLKQYAADLAIDRAMSQLTLSQDTDSALIAEFSSINANWKSATAGGKN